MVFVLEVIVIIKKIFLNLNFHILKLIFAIVIILVDSFVIPIITFQVLLYRMNFL